MLYETHFSKTMNDATFGDIMFPGPFEAVHQASINWDFFPVECVVERDVKHDTA